MAFLRQPRAREVAVGATFAVLLTYNASLVLGFGLFGSHGNSVVTGALLFTLPVVLFLLTFRRHQLHFQPADAIFASLIIVGLISFSINATEPRFSATKEHLLLTMTFVGYIACRSMGIEDMRLLLPAFKRTLATIVTLGAVFTGAEILREWNGPPGKPLVFGFNAAGTYFMQALSLLIIALVSTEDPSPRRTSLISAMIFLPTAIFAAAMVRFTFIAVVCALLVSMIFTGAGERWHVAAIILTIFLATAVGLIARQNSTILYASYVLETPVSIRTGAADVPSRAGEMPSCSLLTNRRNSIAIREALVMDALHLIPTAGFVGTGLDSFMKFSCIKEHEVHVSILQMTVEFGWLGGFLFLLLIGLAFSGLPGAASASSEVRFVLCAVVFVALLSLAHGRVSRESAFFALLGCSVGIGYNHWGRRKPVYAANKE